MDFRDQTRSDPGNIYTVKTLMTASNDDHCVSAPAVKDVNLKTRLDVAFNRSTSCLLRGGFRAIATHFSLVDSARKLAPAVLPNSSGNLHQCGGQPGASEKVSPDGWFDELSLVISFGGLIATRACTSTSLSSLSFSAHWVGVGILNPQRTSKIQVSTGFYHIIIMENLYNKDSPEEKYDLSTRPNVLHLKKEEDMAWKRVQSWRGSELGVLVVSSSTAKESNLTWTLM
jgi:hypothetical protein